MINSSIQHRQQPYCDLLTEVLERLEVTYDRHTQDISAKFKAAQSDRLPFKAVLVRFCCSRSKRPYFHEPAKTG